jgi:spermidine/putrescine-binding protein
MVIWEGYAAPAFAEKFEEENDATINATPMSSSDDAFARLQAGGGSNFDLVSASNDVSQRLIDAGLVQAIDPTRLTNFDDLYEQFQYPSYITKDDELYGANFAWGPTLMLYNTEQVAEEPTSWSALLDEQYAGKISTWNAPIQIAQYALLLDPKPEDPYLLDDEQLAQVRDILLQQRPLIRTYWNLGDELKQLYASGEVVISDAWPYVTLGLQDQGVPVAEVIPSEGVTGWSDSWMLTSGAQNVDLAYKWMDYMIGPDGQMGVLNGNNYAITNRVVIEGLDPELREGLRMDNIEEGYESILMWRNVPNYDKWLQIWQEVTAG